MAKHRIGTNASMATHINNICERNYMKIGPSRKLIPTKLGSSLVHGYNKIDPELVAPDLSRLDQVFKNILDIFRKKFMLFRENISHMDAFFSGSFGTFEDAVLLSR